MPKRHDMRMVERARILMELTIHVAKGPVNTHQVMEAYGVQRQLAHRILKELIELHDGGVVRVKPDLPFTVAARGYTK